MAISLWMNAALWLAFAVAVYFAACIAFFLARPRASLPEAGTGARLPPFPAGFLFGTAASAFQIDGGAGLTDWSRFEEEPGRIARGDRSGIATGHRARVEEDVERMAALGADAYRLSLEWARLEPSEGVWDEREWELVAAELRLLRRRGIEPMVTLLHFTLPLWLASRGGATAADLPERMARFAREAALRLGSEADLFCTVNEPNVQMFQGYVEGVWPPALRSPKEAVRAFAGLLRAHAAAAAALRRAHPRARVGAAVNLIHFEPRSRWSLLDWLAAEGAERAFNWAFADSVAAGRIRLRIPGFPRVDEPLEGLRGSLDFLGINYYTRYLVRFSPRAPGLVERRPGPGPKSDLGWEIRPQGMLSLLRRAWARYRLPIYVTENGIADAAGESRPRFLRDHLLAISRALGEDVAIRGYFHWSLLDNFEWAEGFAPRFGLYRIDYRTLERIETPGVPAYRELIREARSSVG